MKINKVKYITGYNIVDVENNTNSFLKDEKCEVINIKHVMTPILASKLAVWHCVLITLSCK